MSEILRNDYATQADLDEALAGFVADKLAEAIALRGKASMVVSGGNTPKGFFERLSQRPLPWAQVSLTLADERWLPSSDQHSNEAGIRSNLLRNAAAEAHFVPLFDGSATAAAAVPAVAQRLACMARPFDVVILGMGIDGHTASLFSGTQEGLQDGGDMLPCVAVPAPSEPNVPVPRLSLTAATLTDCRHLVLHITGVAKRELLQQALRPGPVAELPVRLALRQERPPCRVYWAP
ncbi:6-phosphogluconolactonase [Noviherbaspirillum sedimenti]|nr:6-phosphogluconolactonase [Noviherbaspirillum sedimenti]